MQRHGGCLVCAEHELSHLKSLEVSLDVAHKIKVASREQKFCVDWHLLRKPRVKASRLWEVCRVRGQSSAEHLAEGIISGPKQTAEMERGVERGLQLNTAG